MIPKKKTPIDQTQEALREIFEGPPEHRDDFKSFAPKPRRRRVVLFVVIGFLVLAALLAVAGFFFFTPKKEFSGAAVAFTIDGQEEAASGDELVWTVTVANKGEVALKKAEVNIRYPTGFTFLSSKPEPVNEFSNSWQIGSVPAKSEKSVKLTGRLLGEVGTKLEMSGTVGYQPVNFSSDFAAEASFTTLITNSTLDLAIKAPTAATSGQKVEYVVTAKNTSTAALERVRLQLEYPAGLSEIKKTPPPNESGTQWDIDRLEPGKETSVTISGILDGEPRAVAELKARVGILDGEGTYRVQRERSALVLFLEPTLNVTVTVNGSAKAQSANSGDKLNVEMTYSNDSDNILSDATVTLAFAGKDSDGAAVNLIETGGIKTEKAFAPTPSKTEIQWTKNQIKELAELLPGAKGTITATLPLLKNVRTVGSGKNLAVDVLARVKAGDVGGTGTGFETTSDAVSVKLTTELRLAVEGRYYNEEATPVGSGPLPPEVGATTSYQISWFLTNTLNGAKDALLKTTLPDGAQYVSAESTGGNNITYDATTREVRWRIDKIDAGVGQTLPTLVGYFTVSVTPKETDVGNALALVGTTSLTATDAFSGATLKVSGNGVTTDIPLDTLAQGKGNVVPAGTSTNTNTASNTNGTTGN